MKPAKRGTTAKAALFAVATLGVCLSVTLALVPRRAEQQGDVAATIPQSVNGLMGAEDASDLAATADVPLWEVVDEAVIDPLPRFSTGWSVEGRVLVRVSAAMSNATAWRVGDRLTLPLPQLGAVYRPVVERIDDGPGPTRSALGKVRGDDGRRHRFVVTVGPAHVLAYIDTPRGPYELVGDNAFGWLLPTSSMMAGLHHGKPDHNLPDDADP